MSNEKGTWFVETSDGLHRMRVSQDSAAETIIDMMTVDPTEEIKAGRTGRRAYWWRGAGGCGNEMHPSNGSVIQRFCKFEAVDQHCVDCPNYTHHPRRR